MKRCAALLCALILVSLYAGAAEAPVSRGDFVVALWESGGAVPSAAATVFSDLAQNDDSAEAVGWAAERGLVQGTGGGRFEAERSITREEAAALLRRYSAYLGRDTFLPDGVAECNEGEGISPWADDALYWATDTGLIAWSEGGRLDPAGAITPTQLGQILYRLGGGTGHFTPSAVPS